MKVVITGINGFLGKVLLAQLKENDKIEIIAPELCGLRIDINDFEAWKNFIPKEVDFFIHLAAKSFVPDSYTHPLNFYNVNVGGTLNILELCRLANSKLIFISSYVYGIPQYLPIDEVHPIQSFNPYASSKIFAENLCRDYFQHFNVSTTILRPFNIYGKNQPSHFLLPSIINQAKVNKKILLKDSRPKRDYIHVNDVANAILKSLFLKQEGINVFNIGSGKSQSIKDILDILNRQNNIDISFTNEIRPNEVLDTIANVKKANEVLNWQPLIEFEQGILNLYNETEH